MTDTHTHLYLFDYQQGEKALTRALNFGIDRLIFPAVDETSIHQLIKMANKNPNNVNIAWGLHPTSINKNWQYQLANIENIIEQSGIVPVAIGECGVDLYWDTTYAEEQREAFAQQVEIAAEKDLPLIIHCRKGLEVVLDVLKERGKGVRGVFHSFSGTKADVEKIRTVGDFYFGINGIVTYKNAPELREALSTIGLSRILLETDSPYLAPVPHRGKRNESSYLHYIADAVAKELGITKQEIEIATDENANNLFDMKS